MNTINKWLKCNLSMCDMCLKHAHTMKKKFLLCNSISSHFHYPFRRCVTIITLLALLFSISMFLFFHFLKFHALNFRLWPLTWPSLRLIWRLWWWWCISSSEWFSFTFFVGVLLRSPKYCRHCKWMDGYDGRLGQ